MSNLIRLGAAGPPPPAQMTEVAEVAGQGATSGTQKDPQNLVANFTKILRFRQKFGHWGKSSSGR